MPLRLLVALIVFALSSPAEAQQAGKIRQSKSASRFRRLARHALKKEHTVTAIIDGPILVLKASIH
jgi:hypothetical protein